MLPDRVSNPRPLTYESGALPIAPRGPAIHVEANRLQTSESESESELFTGDTSKDNHSPGPVFREVSP